MVAQIDKCLDLSTHEQNLVFTRLAEVAVVARLALLKGAGQSASGVGRDEPGPNEVLLKERDHAAMPRRVQVTRREQRTRRVKGRLVQTVHRADEQSLLGENVGFVQCGSCPINPVLGKRAGRIHSGMLSRVTFLMNAVSDQTGCFRIAGVTTRGEM